MLPLEPLVDRQGRPRVPRLSLRAAPVLVSHRVHLRLRRAHQPAPDIDRLDRHPVLVRPPGHPPTALAHRLDHRVPGMLGSHKQLQGLRNRAA